MAAIVLHHHLGLGDHFICNGLVHTVLERYDRVYLPSKRHYLEAIRCLYSDDDAIEVFPVDDEASDVEAFAAARGCSVLRVGFEQCDKRSFDESFYRQLDIPFENRHSRFKLPRIIPHEDELFDLLSPGGDYCLIHREGSLGVFDLAIDSPLPRVDIRRTADPFNNILGFRKLIHGAKEIHCINSSVVHLVDSIDPDAALFYHKVRRTDFHLRSRWTVVPYASSPIVGTWRRAVARVRLIRARSAQARSDP